jgi:hypothetical protein
MMSSKGYRHLAAQEAALARAAVFDAAGHQNYAKAYYTRLAEAKERLVTAARKS